MKRIQKGLERVKEWNHNNKTHHNQPTSTPLRIHFTKWRLTASLTLKGSQQKMMNSLGAALEYRSHVWDFTTLPWYISCDDHVWSCHGNLHTHTHHLLIKLFFSRIFALVFGKWEEGVLKCWWLLNLVELNRDFFWSRGGGVKLLPK